MAKNEIGLAFENLLNTIEKTVLDKFNQLDTKIKEKRLQMLQSDLEELRKREQ